MNNKIFIANLKERREEFKATFGMYPEQRKNQQLADEIERIAREKAEARKRQLTSAVARYNFHTSGSVLKVQNGPIVSKSKRVTKAGASAVLEQGKIDLQNKQKDIRMIAKNIEKVLSIEEARVVTTDVTEKTNNPYLAPQLFISA